MTELEGPDGPLWCYRYQPSPECRLLDWDNTGKTEWFLDCGGDEAKVITVMPVDNMLETNATYRSENAGAPWGDGLARVATIPPHIMQRELMPAIQQGDDAYVKRWLNDSEHRKWRTRDGRV